MEKIKNILEEEGVKGENLGLEVTESSVMDDPDSAIEILQSLIKEGFVISIDDFGTGYSSLSYLKKLPIQILKIDRSFLQGIPEDNENKAIVRSIISIAKSLNLKMVAEGVESTEQINFLLKNGCNIAQGYYYSKPLPLEEIIEEYISI